MAEPKIKTIPMEFRRLVLKHEGEGSKTNVVAIYAMTKPSNLHVRSLPLPEVRLEIQREKDVYDLEIMHKIRDRAILRLEAIKERELGCDAFLEPYDGCLAARLCGVVVDNQTDLLPSEVLRDTIRELIIDLEMLRRNGIYHGQLTIHNVYYNTETDDPILKFANFCKINEDADLKSAQLLDWRGLGNVIAYISSTAKALKISTSYAVIDHLAAQLQALNDVEILPHLKDELLRGPFFWDPRKRSCFYIHELQQATEDPIFIGRVENYNNWTLPWGADPMDGLIAAMDDHRTKVLKKQAYDRSSAMAYVRCIVGAYTHDEELKGKIVDRRGKIISVDTAVQRNSPDLCLTLYRLYTGEIAAVQLLLLLLNKLVEWMSMMGTESNKLYQFCCREAMEPCGDKTGDLWSCNLNTLPDQRCALKESTTSFHWNFRFHCMVDIPPTHRILYTECVT